MAYPDRRVLLLNDWWDFIPIAHDDITTPIIPTSVPDEGWGEGKYLVPGFFTDHPYPEEWRSSRSGWARTTFTVESMPPEERAFLRLDAAIPKAHVFINGVEVAALEDMFLGGKIDITPCIKEGENELAVFLTEFRTFPHPETGDVCTIDVPWGCCISKDQAGIWQDVSLEWRPSVYVDDVTIRTYVRENSITVIAKIRNDGDRNFSGKLMLTVEDAGVDQVRLKTASISLEANQWEEITITEPWSDYRAWSNHDPHLYHLRADLSADGEVVDRVRERFGFREVWIDGHRVMLNGVPQRWSGEWCHKSHSHWLRPEYVRQWYRQVLDANMNYVRMHTFPHPEYFLDIADEMGIFVCQESAIHGSGPHGHDSPELWERAYRHAENMVRRDKNHPSLVLWSVENEMRWSLNIVPSAKDRLPGLRLWFNKLDPTRPAYHDGDSSLWNEDEQPIISRHYGPACHGLGWWDRRAPLHSGEMGRWHYGSPYVALQWAGDEVFTHYRTMSESIARDCARIVELARSNEVTCMFIWNTSGLDNFRPAEARAFTWDEPRSRFVKPLAHKPHESEYAWWEEGTGYRPGFSFPIMREAFRPLAIVIKEERTQFFTDRAANHTIFLVNDLASKAEGTLSVRLMQDGKTIWEESRVMTVPAGGTAEEYFRVPLTDAKTGNAEIISIFSTEDHTDSLSRAISLSSPTTLDEPLDIVGISIFGDGAINKWLKRRGVNAEKIDDLADIDPEEHPILIISEQTIEPGSKQNIDLEAYAKKGGRLLILEQTYSPFPGLPIERMPVEMAHVRDAKHPALYGVTSEQLRFFGDDPFGLPSSNSWVTVYPYAKPKDDHLIHPLIDNSGGDYGVGGLRWSPLVEARIGAGVVIACQLRLSDRWEDLPVADRLWENALSYLAHSELPDIPIVAADAVMQERLSSQNISITDQLDDSWLLFLADGTPQIPAEEMKQRLEAGLVAVVWPLTPETVPYWEQVIGKKIELFAPETECFHLIRSTDSPLLAGISNEDTCWLDNWSYSRRSDKSRVVDQLAVIKGAKNLLENAPYSGIDMLFGKGLGTEWKRMPTMSMVFDNPPERVGAGLAEIKMGAGWVIFSQLRWLPEIWQFRRFLGQFLWDLCLPVGTNILAGDSTPMTGKMSDGYPNVIRATRLTDEKRLEEAISLSKRRAESYSTNTTFLDWAPWHLLEAADGKLEANSIPGEGPIIIGLEIVCPEPRKFMQTTGGLPNPDLQTFLRMTGNGTVRAWVNSVKWSSAPLSPDKVSYIADIDFEAGANFMILLWEPASEDGELNMMFESKEHHPETTFSFASNRIT